MEKENRHRCRKLEQHDFTKFDKGRKARWPIVGHWIDYTTSWKRREPNRRKLDMELEAAAALATAVVQTRRSYGRSWCRGSIFCPNSWNRSSNPLDWVWVIGSRRSSRRNGGLSKRKPKWIACGAWTKSGNWAFERRR